VRAESMPQRVRMHIRRQPMRHGNLLHNPPHTPCGQPPRPAQPRIQQQSISIEPRPLDRRAAALLRG
jgi:hypothetical protein